MVMKARPGSYEIKDPLHINRWMCGKCGLVLDYQFEPEMPGWPVYDPPLDRVNEWQDQNGDYHYDEPERRELCPRCSVDLNESPLIPVAIDKFNLGSFLKTTFIVEDRSQESIILGISKCFDKDVSVIKAGNSSNVKNFFRFVKSRGELDFAYFLVDGDNQGLGKEFTQESHFVQLAKYCIENSLLDFAVCASISGKTENAVKKVLLKAIQGKSQKLVNTPLGKILIERLTISDMKPDLLSCIDASEFIEDFISNLGFTAVNRFREKYINYCFETSRLGTVFPLAIVDAIKNSKIKPISRE